MPQPLYRFNAGLFASDIVTYETADDSIMFDRSDPPPVDRLTASFRNELARYTYKPGVTLTIEPPKVSVDLPTASRFALGFYDTTPHLKIVMEVPDSRNVTQYNPPRVVAGVVTNAVRHTIKVAFQHAIPEELTFKEWGGREERSERFAYFLRLALEKVELHEMREWWRRDGELVDDPHAKPDISKIGPIAP